MKNFYPLPGITGLCIFLFKKPVAPESLRLGSCRTNQFFVSIYTSGFVPHEPRRIKIFTNSFPFFFPGSIGTVYNNQHGPGLPVAGYLASRALPINTYRK